MNLQELPLQLELTKLLFQIKNQLLTKQRPVRVKAKERVKKVNVKNKTDLSLFKELSKLPRKVKGKNKDNAKQVIHQRMLLKFNKEKVYKIIVLK